MNTEAEQAMLDRNIAAESILLRERIDKENRVRELNRSRRRVLAMVQQDM